MHKMLCIILKNTPVVDSDICAIGVLFISYLEGTKYYALLSVTHKLLTGVFVPLELPFSMSRYHKKMCLTSCSFWQRYLYHWNILILCIGNQKCFVLPWETYWLLIWIFVPLEWPYFMFRRHKMLCMSSCNTLVADRGACTCGVSFIRFGKHTMLCIVLSNTPIADRAICTVELFVFCVC